LCCSKREAKRGSCESCALNACARARETLSDASSSPTAKASGRDAARLLHSLEIVADLRIAELKAQRGCCRKVVSIRAKAGRVVKLDCRARLAMTSLRGTGDETLGRGDGRSAVAGKRDCPGAARARRHAAAGVAAGLERQLLRGVDWRSGDGGPRRVDDAGRP